MPESGPFEFGSFRLDGEKSVLWRSGQLVPLTPKALALLQALVEHDGDVVSKQTLMGRVWPDAAVQEANLSVTVAALRKALGPQPDGRSYVQTVPKRGYRFDAPLHLAGSGPELGLAVLPFSCLGPETEAHLGLGLADALIGRLTEVVGLRVRPTGAVTQYLAHPKAPREAAKELGVDAVVGGTVQRDGGRIRVSVQLVPLPAALRPWADSFDADWTDLFGVQDALAERVAQALALRLAPHRPPADRQAPQPEAYEAHLRGRYFWSRFDPEGLGKAFGYYGEAVRLDPRYAPPMPGSPDATCCWASQASWPRVRPGTSRRNAPIARSSSIPLVPKRTCRAPTPACFATGIGRERASASSGPLPSPLASRPRISGAGSSWVWSATWQERRSRSTAAETSTRSRAWPRRYAASPARSRATTSRSCPWPAGRSS